MKISESEWDFFPGYLQYWDHLQEMNNTLRGLRNNAETLKNVNNPEARAAYDRAIQAIDKIESSIKGYGI